MSTAVNRSTPLSSPSGPHPAEPWRVAACVNGQVVMLSGSGSGYEVTHRPTAQVCLRYATPDPWEALGVMHAVLAAVKDAA